MPSDAHRSGELQFENGYTGLVGPNGGDPQSGLGMGSFLLGEVTNFARYVSTSTDAQERQKRFFWYAQDTFRITPKLQINYGLRWEMVFPEKVNAPGNGAQLNLATGKIGVFGIGKVSMHGYQEMNWKNFAPRLGITYQLTQKTVVRAGYGWAYELGTFGSIFGHNVTQNIPVLARQSISRAANFAGVFSLSEGPPALAAVQPDANGEFPLPNGISGKARPTHLVMPRVMTFNFTVQHQLARDLALTVGYVGNQGRHVFISNGPDFDVNSPAFIPGVPLNERRPFYSRYGWTNDIRLYCNCANNRYDSLQVQLEKRYSGGLTFQASYTFQESQGDGFSSSGVDYSFLYNRKLGYGTNGLFPFHQFIFAPTWEIPFGKGTTFRQPVATSPGCRAWADGISTRSAPFTAASDSIQITTRPPGSPSGCGAEQYSRTKARRIRTPEPNMTGRSGTQAGSAERSHCRRRTRSAHTRSLVYAVRSFISRIWRWRRASP